MYKLLQINSVVNTGSTGRIAEDLSDYVIKKGWNSYIAYGRYGNASNSMLIKIGNRFDNYWHFLQTMLFDRHGLESRIATKNLVRKIEKIKPDIIHLHNIHGYYINIDILFKYLSTIPTPIVWTFHDCWAFTGHCTYFEMMGCEKWRTECNNCPQKNIYPASYFLDRSKKNYYLKKELINSVNNLKIIPVSHWLNNLVKTSFLDKISTKVIHNGLDLKKFKPKTTNNLLIEKYNLKNYFVILGVANVWSEGKGLLDFIELSKRISENQIIIMVGLNNNQLKKLPKNIIGILRTQSIEELCEFYSVADVFVNPTYQDSFGMVNIEAQACGTPVITYDTGGSPETISEKTGFVIEKGNIDNLLDKIEIIKNKGKNHYSNACMTRASDFFDKEFKYHEYYDLYLKLLNK